MTTKLETKPQATAMSRPWRQHATLGKVYASVRSVAGGTVADCGSRSDNVAQANAALIVEAVNQHEALIYALQTISDAGVKGPLAIADFYSIMEVAKAALESVRKETV